MVTRHSAPLALLALLIACSAPAGGGGATGSAEDEQAIRGIADKYAAAMTAKDTAAFGKIVADDYEVIDPTGKHMKGRADVMAQAVEEMASVPAGVTMSMKTTTDFVRFIDASHAVAGGTYEVSPAMPPIPTKGSWMGVMVKQGAEWKMMSAMGSPDMTAMMPAPPPAPAAKP